jgi:hypothetical protein
MAKHTDLVAEMLRYIFCKSGFARACSSGYSDYRYFHFSKLSFYVFFAEISGFLSILVYLSNGFVDKFANLYCRFAHRNRAEEFCFCGRDSGRIIGVKNCDSLACLYSITQLFDEDDAC